VGSLSSLAKLGLKDANGEVTDEYRKSKISSAVGFGVAITSLGWRSEVEAIEQMQENMLGPGEILL